MCLLTGRSLSNSRHARSRADSCIMRTRQETRHRLIAAGLLICTLALVPLLLSLVYEVEYLGERWSFGVYRGGLGWSHGPLPAEVSRGWTACPAKNQFLIMPYIGRPWGRGKRLLALMPLWPLVVVAGAGVVLVWRFYGRVLPGHCAVCAYDLTRNTSGRCPECGTSIATT